VVGGKAHQEVLLSIIRSARHDLIIHSTFLAEDRVEAVWPMLVAAVQRGARVHILWGEDREKSGTSPTRRAISSLRDKIVAMGLDGQLRVHPFSTGSHAKIIVADTGRLDRHVAVIGSCNWLYSGFSSFECSVRLRDPSGVAGIVEQLAELSQGVGRHWTDLTNYFARLAFDVARQPIPGGAKAKSRLVLGAEHSAFIHQARDEAKNRIFVTSHRIGSAARIGLAVPGIAAAKGRGLKNIRAYFGMPASTGDGVKAAELARDARDASDTNVDIRPVFDPTVHAKVLAWDDDFAVITSLNWLSADPNERNRRGEIGIYLNAAGVARRIIDVFENSKRP
jgi:cardiolipin synthase